MIKKSEELFDMSFYYWGDVDVAYIKHEISDDNEVWKIYSSNGVELAVTENRKLAFVIAKQNDFVPQSVH